MADRQEYINAELRLRLSEFMDGQCKGRFYDSCHDSPCPYSSHLYGCTHPLHPKNQEVKAR